MKHIATLIAALLVLCGYSLEGRLGRYLRPKDFVPDDGFNLPGVPASERLRDRRGF